MFSLGVLFGNPEEKKTVLPRKLDMSLENQWLEDVFPTENSSFLGDLR